MTRTGENLIYRPPTKTYIESMSQERLPRISIVVPSFNQGSFIRETLDSILNQGYPDLEVLVIDGGSTDNTIEILKEYGPRISWVSEKDKGQTDAINKGLGRVTGEVVAYLCSDDLYRPGALLDVGRFFSENPEAQWLNGEYEIIDEKGRLMQSFVVQYKKYFRKRPSLKSLLVLNYLAQPSTFWRRSLYQEIGPLNETLHYVMDYEYWLRIYRRYPLATTDRVLSAFRIHSQSKSGSRYKPQFKEELEVAARFADNKVLLFLHRVHTFGILAAYGVMK